MNWKLGRTLALAAMLATVLGCHGAPMRSSAYGPPPDQVMTYDDAMGPGAPVGEEKGFVDRHPVLAAPRNYWRDSGDNVLVKAFYGTVVGIPVGIAREGWQILYGQ